MKTFLKLFSVTVFFILLASNSFSTPLSGTYTIGSGGSNLASGIYYYKHMAEGDGNNFVANKKMMLLK